VLPLYEKRHRVFALPTEFRRQNHERIARLAAQFGLKPHFCGCKNRDVTSETCRIAGTDDQLLLPLDGHAH
jgi:hypothetical protein